MMEIPEKHVCQNVNVDPGKGVIQRTKPMGFVYEVVELVDIAQPPGPSAIR
jgi:hypothetical protein